MSDKKRARVVIEIDEISRNAKVLVDGRNITDMVRRLTFNAGAGELTRVTLELVQCDVSVDADIFRDEITLER